MPFMLLDVDALEAEMTKKFDSCPLQEGLLMYARGFELAMWVPQNLDTVIGYIIQFYVDYVFAVPLSMIAEM